MASVALLAAAAIAALLFLRFLPELRPLLPDPRMQALLEEAGFID